jgi:hypothetical protein
MSLPFPALTGANTVGQMRTTLNGVLTTAANTASAISAGDDTNFDDLTVNHLIANVNVTTANLTATAIATLATVNISGATTLSGSILHSTGQTATMNGTLAANVVTVSGSATLSGANTNITGGTLLVTSNVVHTATETFNSAITLNGSTVFNGSGTFYGAIVQVAGQTATLNGTLSANVFNVSGATTLSGSILHGTGLTATLNGTTSANVFNVSGATTLSGSILHGTGLTATLNGTTTANVFNATGKSTLSGANTDITGGTLLVTSNTVTTGNMTIDGTLVAKQGMPIRTAGGNSVTLALIDNGTFIRCANSTSAMDIHIPINSAIAFPIGTEISFMNELTHASANTLGIAKTSGVTLLAKDDSGTAANTIADRYTTGSLKKLAINTWLLVGAI